MQLRREGAGGKGPGGRRTADLGLTVSGVSGMSPHPLPSPAAVASAGHGDRLSL